MRCLLLFLLVLSTKISLAQSKNEIHLCCAYYKKHSLYFSIFSRSESRVNIIFSYKGKIGSAYLISSEVKSDTIIFQLLDESQTGISSTGDMHYEVEGKLYSKRSIAPHESLQLAVKLSKSASKKNRYIKMKLPDSQEVVLKRALKGDKKVVSSACNGNTPPMPKLK